jgi:hypothetical protein
MRILRWIGALALDQAMKLADLPHGVGTRALS